MKERKRRVHFPLLTHCVTRSTKPTKMFNKVKARVKKIYT